MTGRPAWLEVTYPNRLVVVLVTVGYVFAALAEIAITYVILVALWRLAS